MINIIVLIKPVPEKYVDNNSVDKDNLVINPYDLFSLVNIIELKNKFKNINIVCVSMGGLKAKDVMIKCRALGADDVVLLSDDTFVGSDTYATTYILEQAIKKIGNFDIIACGKQSVDGETGQVGYGLAYRLGIECFSRIKDIIEVNAKNDYSLFGSGIGNKKDTGTVTFVHINGENEETIKTEIPVMLIFDSFITQKNISLLKLKKSRNIPITIWNHEALNADISLIGVKGSKTKVLNVESMIEKKKNIIIEGTIDEKAEFLLNLMKIEDRKK